MDKGSVTMVTGCVALAMDWPETWAADTLLVEQESAALDVLPVKENDKSPTTPCMSIPTVSQKLSLTTI